MRGWIIALSLLGPGAALAETFPYTATVTSLNVAARSGPSFGTYPTERLLKHTQVEVQRTEGAGWAAIHPTREAFNWLPASAVKLSTDRKAGEIVVDRAPAYIGSNVRKIDEHVSQSDLKKGDTVRVLAEKSSSRGAGKPELWLKIAPPAGEVRWVQTKHLSTDSPELLAASETQERLAREERYRRENAIDPPGLLANLLKAPEKDDARPDTEVARAQFLRRGRAPLLRRKPREAADPVAEEGLSSVEIDNGQPSEAVGSDSADEASPRVPSDKQSRVSLDPEGLTAAEPERELPTLAPPVKAAPPPVSPAPSTPPIDSEEFKQRLTRLHVDLTAMVAEDSSKWSLTPLRRRAEELVKLGPSPLERGKARLLLDRIAEFAATLPPGHEELSRESPVAIAATATAEKKPNFVTQYDAVGYLMPIVGARPGTPQYQLTDKDGRSLSLVSAQPGINLNAYVKKQVGLYGQRGYVESLKKHHVLAERVVDLDLHRR